MKKKILFLTLSLSMLMLVWGCRKKDVENKVDDTTDNAPTVTAGAADTATTDGTTTDGTTTDGTAAETVAPTKEAYEVSDYITLGEYKGIEVTVEKLEVTEADIDAAIQTELEANATDEEVTGRAVENGDIVNIDYEGLKDGVAFEGGTAQAADLTIGSNTFIPGFEEQLVGANIGDKLALDITFPEDYSQSPELAGQPVVFNVTVNSIKKSVVPELTLEYVTTNTDFDTIEAFREGSRATLQTTNEETMKNDKINSVLAAIVENAAVSSIPETLIEYYKYEMTDYYTQYAAMFGMDFAAFLASSGMTEESFATERQTYAESRATQELVINAVIKAEKIELSDDEYKEGLAKIVTDYGYATEAELFETATETQIKESLLWEKAVKYLSEQAVEL